MVREEQGSWALSWDSSSTKLGRCGVAQRAWPEVGQIPGQVVVESQANGMCIGRGSPELCPRQMARQGDEDSELPVWCEWAVTVAWVSGVWVSRRDRLIGVGSRASGTGQ